MHVMWLQILTYAMNRAQFGSDTAPAMRRTEQILCLSLIFKFWLPVSSLHYLAASLPHGIFQGTAVCFEVRALCDQLCNIAFPRMLGSDVPTVPASFTPWTVIAESNPPLELDALIQATASLFLLLDVQVFHRHCSGPTSGT